MRTLTHSSIPRQKHGHNKTKNHTLEWYNLMFPRHAQSKQNSTRTLVAQGKKKIKFKISGKKPSERKKDRSSILQKQQHPLSPLQQVRSEQVERR